MNKKCEICGAPCLIRYCKKCAKKAYLQNAKEKRLRNSKKFTGCDEDCFNCPYPDCRKPAQLLKPDKALKEALNTV